MAHIRKVYDNLLELQEALGELRTLVLQEREDVTALNLIGLNERRSLIEALFKRVREMNETTAVLIATACGIAGVAGKPGLSTLIAAIPKPDRDLFAKLQRSLQMLASGVENELSINRALLRDSLAFTHQSMQMFTSILKTSSTNTYGQQGRFRETVDQPRIICKEI